MTKTKKPTKREPIKRTKQMSIPDRLAAILTRVRAIEAQIGAQHMADAKGQQKLHTITNTTTGETKQVTQEDWRLNGKQYRAEGWTRPDDDTEIEPPEPPAV
jgi:hypothetical protein